MLYWHGHRKGYLLNFIVIRTNVVIWTLLLTDRNSHHFPFMSMKHQCILLNKVCWHLWAAEKQVGSAHCASSWTIMGLEEASVRLVAGLRPISNQARDNWNHVPLFPNILSKNSENSGLICVCACVHTWVWLEPQQSETTLNRGKHTHTLLSASVLLQE